MNNKATIREQRVIKETRETLKRLDALIKAEKDPKEKRELKEKYERLSARLGALYTAIIRRDGLRYRVEARAYGPDGNLIIPEVKFY